MAVRPYTANKTTPKPSFPRKRESKSLPGTNLPHPHPP